MREDWGFETPFEGATAAATTAVAASAKQQLPQLL
jgi:hypothetical protein